MIKEVCTALVTSFENGELDLKSLDKLLNFQLESGIKSFCVCGTTGEISTLTSEEYSEIISTVVKKSKEKAFVLAGVGGNCTTKVIENCKKCEDLGVNAVLAITPYYNKPNQDGIYAHFEKIAEKTKLPIILYNVPGRTITDISDDTIAKLSKIENIVGIKECSGLLERTAILRSKLINAGTVNKFKIISGDDINVLAHIAMGDVEGVISVASNAIPVECIELFKFAKSKKFTEARNLQDKFAIFFDLLFVETNPQPIKYILSKLGYIKNELRLPLISVSDLSRQKIDSEMGKILKI